MLTALIREVNPLADGWPKREIGDKIERKPKFFGAPENALRRIDPGEFME